MRLVSCVTTYQAIILLARLSSGFRTSFYLVGLLGFVVHKILCTRTHPVSAFASTGPNRCPSVAIIRSRSINRRKRPCSA